MGRKRDAQLLLRLTAEEKEIIDNVLKDMGMNKNDGILKIIKDYSNNK